MAGATPVPPDVWGGGDTVVAVVDATGAGAPLDAGTYPGVALGLRIELDGTLLRLTGPAAPTLTPTPTLDPTWARLALPIIIKK